MSVVLSSVRLFTTPRTVAHQASLSMGFSRHEYWSGLPFSSPGDLPDPGIESWFPSLQADYLPSEPPGKSREAASLISHLHLTPGFPGGTVIKNLPANAGDARDSGLIPWIRKIPWSRDLQPTPVFMPGESPGQRNQLGCSP